MPNDVRARASLKDDLSGPLTRIGDVWNKQSKNFATGALAAQGVSKAFSLVDRALASTIGYLGDSAQAYRDDQVSVQKLTTALRSNVDGWDGNTKAIEDVIAARMKLGFSDDAQRSSLGELVGAYGDVTKALAAERTAMDLARYSGVDLATASDTLIKVHAGNYRALKALGIQTAGITNETEALAAIQKVASGQAEDYANTLQGKLDVAQVKAEESSEKFGKSVARLQAEVIPAAADAVSGLADALDDLQTATDGTAKPEEEHAARIDVLRGIFGGINPMFDEYVNQLDRQAEAAAKLYPSIGRVRDDLEDYRRTTQRGATDTANLTREMDDLYDVAKNADGAIDDLSDTLETELFGKAITTGNIAEARELLDTLGDEEPAKKGSRAWKIWKGRVAEAQQQLFELQLQQAEDAGPDALIAFLIAQRKKFNSADAAAQNYLDTLIAIARKQKVLSIMKTGGTFYTGARPYAEGGHYSAGVPRIVGEKGPELDIPDHGGTIVPNNKLGSGGGSWGGTVININVSTPALTPGGAEALARAIGPAMATYLNRRGMLGA